MSKPGNTDGLSDWSVTSAAVTAPSLVGALCGEEGAIMCRSEAKCSKDLFGELVRGNKILTVHFWQQAKASCTVQW